MLFGGNWEKFLWEGIIFLTFLLICGGLLETRFAKKASILIGGGTVLGIVLLQAGLLMSGQDTMLVLTMLPLPASPPAGRRKQRGVSGNARQASSLSHISQSIAIPLHQV